MATNAATSTSSGSLTATQQMLASGTGAILVSLFATPFDVVKVRLQAQLKPAAPCFVFSNGLMDHVCYGGIPPAVTEPIKCIRRGRMQTIRFSSTFDAFLKIVKYEGISKLWKGLPPTMVMAVPQTVVYFTTYDQLKVRFGLVEGERNIVAPMMSGMISRAFAVAAISPLEMVRTKLQSRKGYKYTDVFRIISGAIRQEGFFSLWRGMGPTLHRDVPFSALYWTVYELLKANNKEVTVGISFAGGAISGLCAAFITTPFDVVKTHRQMELGEMELKPKASSKSSALTLKLIWKLWREKGFRSLFTGRTGMLFAIDNLEKGLTARLAKVAPACAVMISTYEYGKRYFARRNEYIMSHEKSPHKY